MDPGRVSASQKMPYPKSMKEVRAFLCTAGWYRRFVNNFGTLAVPLPESSRNISTPSGTHTSLASARYCFFAFLLGFETTEFAAGDYMELVQDVESNREHLPDLKVDS